MDQYQSLNHTCWQCLYHVVFIPKWRRRMLYVELRRYLGEVFHDLAGQKQSRVQEGHLMPDHVHMLLQVPPKYAVSQVGLHVVSCGKRHFAHRTAGQSGFCGKCLSLDMRR